MTKKIISLLLAATLAVGCLVGCGGGQGNEGGGQAAGYEIALITDKGNIDDKSFNQGAWEGVLAYCEKNSITHQYYKPEEASDEGYFAAIQLAVEGGKSCCMSRLLIRSSCILSSDTVPRC